MDAFLVFFCCKYDIQALHRELGPCDSLWKKCVDERRTDVLRDGGLLLGFHTRPHSLAGSFLTHLPGWTIHFPSNLHLCFSVAEVVSSLASGLCCHPSEQSWHRNKQEYFSCHLYLPKAECIMLKILQKPWEWYYSNLDWLKKFL